MGGLFRGHDEGEGVGLFRGHSKGGGLFGEDDGAVKGVLGGVLICLSQ